MAKTARGSKPHIYVSIAITQLLCMCHSLKPSIWNHRSCMNHGSNSTARAIILTKSARQHLVWALRLFRGVESIVVSQGVHGFGDGAVRGSFLILKFGLLNKPSPKSNYLNIEHIGILNRIYKTFYDTQSTVQLRKGLTAHSPGL